MDPIKSFGIDYSSYDEAIAAHQNEANRLTQECMNTRKEILTSLPGQLGLPDIQSLIVALADFAPPEMKARILSPARSALVENQNLPPKKPAPQIPGRISEENRDQILAALRAGEAVAEIAAQWGVTRNTIQKLKNRLFNTVDIPSN